MANPVIPTECARTALLFILQDEASDMPPAHVEALLDVADDGVAFDGLRVDPEAGSDTKLSTTEPTYEFQTRDTCESGLRKSELGAVARESSYVTNWHFWHAIAPQADSQWEYLRWLEGMDASGSDPAESVTTRYDDLASGLTSDWGQLHIEVSLGDAGNRLYEVRHSDDQGVAADELDTYRMPTDARDLARFDEDGRYRPLKSAPTLQTGWHFVDLPADDLVETVGYVYPASIENWYLEHTDSLDISHWRETMERQSGIYSIVETWDRGEGNDHVERVARTCCTDEECLKRREWGYEPGLPLDAEGGTGEFPCREPCSLVISAARQWTKLEGEESREYTFELTPSEKEQLERILDAVAQDEVGDIREAAFEDGANRWRVRYLREKLRGGKDNQCENRDERE